jgi:glycosyltransferase 2 family protein
MSTKRWHAQKFLSYLLRLAIGFGLIAFVFTKYDATFVFRRLAGIEAHWLAMAGVLMYTAALISSLKWQKILDSYGQKESLSELWMLYIEGGFFNLFFPGFVAGDGLRVARTSKRGKVLGTAFMAVFVERLSGLMAVAVFVGSVTALGGYGALGQIWEKAIAVVVVLVLCALALSINKWFVHMAGALLPDFVGKYVKDLSEKITYAVEMLFAKPNLLKQLILLSFLFVLLSGPVAYCVAQAIDFHIPLYLLMFYAPLIALLSNLPISVGGLGTRETVSVFFYSALGYLPEDIIALAVSQSALLFLVNLSGGIILIRWALVPKKQSA